MTGTSGERSRTIQSNLSRSPSIILAIAADDRNSADWEIRDSATVGRNARCVDRSLQDHGLEIGLSKDCFNQPVRSRRRQRSGQGWIADIGIDQDDLVPAKCEDLGQRRN